MEVAPPVAVVEPCFESMLERLTFPLFVVVAFPELRREPGTPFLIDSDVEDAILTAISVVDIGVDEDMLMRVNII